MTTDLLRTSWPLFDLTIRTPRLELRVPTDELYAEVCEVARSGIHPPGFMPFSHEWTDAPEDQLVANSMRFLWSTRAAWQPDDWHLEFAVLLDGRPVGMKGIWSTDFAVTREFYTGSWLGTAHQGQGIGREMRAAVLHLCFAHLRAMSALSNFYDDNEASRAVNRHHGYVDDGYVVRARRGQPARWNQQRLARSDWLGVHPSDRGISVSGFEAVEHLFIGG